MKKLMIAIMCLGIAWADEMVTKVITPKQRNITQLVHSLGPLLPGSNVTISNDGDHLIMRGPKDTVAGFEEVIKQLDVPPQVKKDVETTVYMLVASSGQAASVVPVPAELEPVVKQLKGLFPYKMYRVMESFVLRSRDGERGETTGMIPTPADSNSGHKGSYTFLYGHVRLEGGDAAKVIRFDALRLSMRFPVTDAKGGLSYFDAGISTDVDVPEGKKVVVGKTSAVEGSDTALILVISAKVVD